MEKLSSVKDKSKGIIEVLRINVKHFLENTMLGKLWVNFMVVLSVASSLLYIGLTYTLVDNIPGTKLYVLFNDLEIYISSMFLADWILSLLKAENKTNFLLG